VERIETRGVWIGMLSDISTILAEDRFEMAPGDVMLLFTDGITEAKSGPRRFLQTDGLQKLFEQVAPSVPTAGIIEHVVQAMKGYVIKDDVTLIAVRRSGAEVAHG
jgi:sigma-B regulation protein RsbU (phosphoserine phosphatase)